MEIKFSDKEQAFRDELDEFLQRELPNDWAEKPISWPHDYARSGYQDEGDSVIASAFTEKVAGKGWFTLFWRNEEGSPAYSYMEQAIFDERMSYYRAPRQDNIGTGIVAPMLLRTGTDQQKQKWLPDIAAGKIHFW